MHTFERCSCLLAGFLALALTVSAQSQQPPPKPEEKPKPAKKAKKVWTEEDLSGLRRPSDEYVEKKAAEADAAAAAKAKKDEAKPGEAAEQKPEIDPVSGKPIYDPDSPEGLQEQLANWEGSLVRLQEALREARAQMADTQDPIRWESAKNKVDILEGNILDTQQRIEELKARLAANPPKEKPAAPAPPPPPPSQ